MEEIIKIENLCKEYKTYKRDTGILENFKSFFHRQTVIVSAVNSINLRVRKGSITGILGPNGAGKSTLIKMMTGVLFPKTGKIDVMGYEPSKDRKKYVREIGTEVIKEQTLVASVFDDKSLGSCRIDSYYIIRYSRWLLIRLTI